MSPELKAFAVMVGAVIVALFTYEFVSGLIPASASSPKAL